MKKPQKDIERKLLEWLLDGYGASQRSWGDRNGTSRLAVFKRRLVERGFPIRTVMLHTKDGDTFGVYFI